MFSGRKIADANSQQIEERLELAIIETGEAEMIATEAERKYRYPPPKFVNLGPKMAKILDFQGGEHFFVIEYIYLGAHGAVIHSRPSGPPHGPGDKCWTFRFFNRKCPKLTKYWHGRGILEKFQFF